MKVIYCFLLPAVVYYAFITFIVLYSIASEIETGPAACSFSFMLASESLLTLESIVTSLQKFIHKFMERNDNHMHPGFIQDAIPILSGKLRASAQKLLRNQWDNENPYNSLRNKVRLFLLFNELMLMDN